jgi:hypothetical protein
MFSGSPGSPIAASSPITSRSKGKSKKSPPRKPLKILNVHVNCQSISPKKAEFQNLIDSTQPDIVVATETWLETGKHHDGEIGEVGQFINKYKIYRRDRKDGYGGVLIAVTHDLISSRVDELESDAEMLWVRINIVGSKTLYVSAFYRPQEQDQVSHESFKSSLSRIVGYPNAHVWIAGDLNFPGIDWSSKTLKPSCRYPALHQDLIDSLDDYGFHQLVSEPTRGQNTLDLFITNNPTLINKVMVIPGISDHHGVLVEGNLTPITNHQQQRQVPLYKKANWDKLKEHVNHFGKNLDKTDNTTSIDLLWLNFKTMLEAGIKKYIPHKTAKKKNSIPWLTSQVKRLIKKRDQLYIRMKKASTDLNINAFKAIKTQAQKQLRRDYWSYIQDMISPQIGSTSKQDGNKKFWSFIKHVKQDSTGVAPLLGEDGKLRDDAAGKAEILNKQFTSVFSKISPLTLAQSATQVLRTHSPAGDPSRMPEIEITEAGVTKMLKNLNPHKAAGPDNIRPLILKELHKEISPILTFMFQKSAKTGELPSEWRQANVAPIFKKGKKQLPENYRPVSLTCICSKLMEHILASNIMQHLESKSILHQNQHGFRARRSCETQLVELVEDLHQTMQKGKQTDIIVMDFSKAFDKVSHTRLLLKLQQYGIGGQTLRWVGNFLSNRSQRVVVDGVGSCESTVTSGVPQGSVLGPILFLIYINDLPECVKSNVRLFADDTILYRQMNTPQDAQTLQEDLDRLVDWEQDWSMEFHPGKCNVIRVTRSNNPIMNTYTLHGHQLEVVSSTKYLGISINEDLCWNKHLNNVTSKAGKILGLVKRNIKIDAPRVKETAYKALVRPLVEYSAAVWDPHTNINIHRVEMIQRRAARWTLNRYHNTSSVTDMLSHLGWPTLQQRRSEARLALMYKMVHGLVAINIGLYVTPVLRHTRHTHPYSFIQIQPRLEAYRMSFFPRTIVEWNQLPSEVVTAPTIDAFKSHLVGLRAFPN